MSGVKLIMREPTRILVTGGAGFIGSHVVNMLLNAGYEVRVIDNLSTGKLANIRDCVKSGKVDLFRGDIRESEVVRKCVDGVDAVIHLAAITSVTFSLGHPSLTFETNVMGTLNLLNSCLEENVKRFILFSSCSVYGEPMYLPIDENHLTHPVTPYAESKLVAERYCGIFQEEHGLETAILRLFNVYGPRQGLSDCSGVVAQFVEQVRRGLPLVICGDGSQTRDFVHVWDVAEAVLRALKNENVAGEIFNIAYGKPYSLNELAKTVLEVADVDLDIVYDKPRVGDLKHSFADISKARELLGYRPKLPLENGLQALFWGFDNGVRECVKC